MRQRARPDDAAFGLTQVLTAVALVEVENRRRQNVVIVVIVIAYGLAVFERRQAGELWPRLDDSLPQVLEADQAPIHSGSEHLIENGLNMVVANVENRERGRRCAGDELTHFVQRCPAIGELAGEHAVERDADRPGVVGCGAFAMHKPFERKICRVVGEVASVQQMPNARATRARDLDGLGGHAAM